jgi:glycosyltransferase involved in cell wall biosynthesis
VILEAWSYGLGVISTDTHGARELIQNGADGDVVPCGDAATLAAQLTALLSSPESARRLGIAGRRKALARYGGEAIVDAYLDLYRRLLG